VAWSIANGADIVRVHDVEAMVKVVRVIRAIQTGVVEKFV
jgi:dihydropteroate synthase